MTGTLRGRRRVLAVGAVTGLALVAAACGSSSKSTPSTSTSSSATAAAANVPGVTATTILLGTHQPLTGPAAPGYSEIAKASQAYFDYVNANGGVNGRKITLKIEDDGYNPTTTATVVRQLVLQDKVFAIFEGLGTPTHTAVLDFLAQNHVPDLFVASGSRSWNQPSKYPGTFGWQPDYTVEGKILGQYVKQNFAGKKVCAFAQADDFGTDGVAGVEKTIGSPLANKQTYVPTNTNVVPQIGALAQGGCQVVVSFTVPGFTALALGTAAKIPNFHPQWVVSNVGADYLTLEALLKTATPLLLQGVVSDIYLPSTFDETNSWIKLFTSVNKTYNGNIPLDGNVEYGMATAFTMVQALKNAGPNLTRQGIIDTIQKNQFSGGPGLTPFAYSATDHSGYTGVQIATVNKGKVSAVGPVYVTDDGDGPITEYSTPPATAPANGMPG
jgi:ABC-type branched-subunit amino acid transport system substrate-binding protein